MTNYLDPGGPVYRGSNGVPSGFDPSIRVVTFNIQFARRVDRAIAALDSHPELRGPDVLVLQEMDAPGVEAVGRALRLAGSSAGVARDVRDASDHRPVWADLWMRPAEPRSSRMEA